jgi:aerobic-type carbon monoxide dehydrogenase small subunit (CoxS/CutS family)
MNYTIKINGESRTIDVGKTTIEALACNPVGQKLQEAWLALDVMQCGYCQAGQLMSAADLREA